MAFDLRAIQTEWATIRSLGAQLDVLAARAEVAYHDANGNAVAPDATTIANIKTEAALVVTPFEAAIARHKTAYTP